MKAAITGAALATETSLLYSVEPSSLSVTFARTVKMPSSVVGQENDEVVEVLQLSDALQA
jgi:hypothetical protein